MSIELIDKIAPKNNAFTGLVDAKQIIGDGGANVLPYNTLPPGIAGGGNVPSGGATTQVLTKNSASNFDTGWATPLKSAGVYNYFDYANITSSNNNNDLITSMQNFLLDCQLKALAIRGQSSIPGLSQRLKVKAIFPWNYYRITCPLIVPEFVDICMYGVVVRDGDTGSITTFYTGDTTTKALANVVQPAVILVPHAHATETLNVMCNSNTGPSAPRGSGIALGKNWTQDTFSTGHGNPTVTAGGTGYTLNDILTCAQPSDQPYVASTYRVSGVSGGVITAVVGVEAGSYALPPVLQAQQWTTANGFNVFDTHGNIKVTGGTGTGASIAPNWVIDFPDVSGDFDYYYSGRGGMIADTIIGHLNPVQSALHGSNIDPTYGQIFLFKSNGLNMVIEELEGNLGYYGLWMQNTSDCRFSVMNTVKSDAFIRIANSSSIECPNFVMDTPTSSAAGILIDDSELIKLHGVGFFRGATNLAAPISPIITVGQFSTGYSRLLDIRMNMWSLGAGANLDANLPFVGGSAFHLENVVASSFFAAIDNDASTVSGVFNPISTFATFGAGVVSCNLAGSISLTFGSLFVGTIPTGLAIDIFDADVSIINGSITATIGGTVTTGDTVTITFSNIQFTHSYLWPRTPHYTAIGGDTTTTIAAGLVAAINADAALSINGVFASNVGAVITIIQMGCYANSTVLTKTVSGSATETVTFSNSGVMSGSIAGGQVKNGGLYELYGAGAPSNGAHGTGWAKAPAGSTYTNTSNGNFYINTNTAASPTWTLNA